MDSINGPGNAPLTADQTAALKKLHNAATQLEGVFVGMLFKQMHAGDDQKSDIFGEKSNAEKTWEDMLDEKRADAVAQTGAFGIAKVIENQLRASVIGTAPATTAPGVPPAVPPASAPPLPAAESAEQQP
jgi:Rod binding domain-containing protein